MKSVISIEAVPVLFEATSSPVVEEEVAVTWIVPTALGVQVVDTEIVSLSRDKKEADV